jgi:RNA polymerase sigma factor (sigma-70 family)
MSLNDPQRKLVEDNLGLVSKVIKDCVRNPNDVGIYSYEDIYQIGCLGLCDAAVSYRADRGAKFDTYAYLLIRNRIYTQLEYATLRKNREQLLDPEEILEARQTEPDFDSIGGLEQLLTNLEQNADGVIAKGIAAIRLQAQGYSCKEIGQRFGGVSDNNVSAWISRARQYLRKQPDVAALLT